MSQFAIEAAACAVTTAAFLVNAFVIVRSGAWGMSDRLSTMEGRIMGVIAGHQSHEAEVADKMRREFEFKLDEHEHNFGETARSMQQKIHEIETWARDEFVRRQSFESALTRIEGTMTRIDAKLDQTQDANSKMAAAIAGLAATAGVKL